MGLKTRIEAKPLPKTRGVPSGNKPKMEKIPGLKLRRVQEFGVIENLELVPAFTKKDAPHIAGYACTGAWRVRNSDAKELAFLALSERLGNTVKLYHGTRHYRSIQGIARVGLRPGGYGCMFGSGIYMGGPQKAFGYTGWDDAKYLLQVMAVLGNVKTCNRAENQTLQALRNKGFDSVCGKAGYTVGSYGLLNLTEYVVYSPDQVLAEVVYEYQATHALKIPAPVPEVGFCVIGLPSATPMSAGNTAFADLHAHRQCGKKSATRVQVTRTLGKEKRTEFVYICADCIERFKIKTKSKILIKSGSSLFNGWETVSVLRGS